MSNLSPLDRATLSLSYTDYLRFSNLMQERFGLAFPEKRRMELEIGVRRAFSASTCQDIDSYYRLLVNSPQGSIELGRLVNYLTIGESHFFRDAGQFDALISNILPDIIERRRMSRTLRIWSAGCANGEEPYSIAILLHHLLPDIHSWNITILGTDINTQHLERARRAVYGEWAFREPRAKLFRSRYFTQHGNQYELNPAIRKMVQFSVLNLSEDHYPSYETNTMFMDLIFCRNVTIYFPESVTRSVVNRFYNALTDNSWFVIGHSEYSVDIYKRFQTHNFPDAILYRRVAEPLAASTAPTSLPAQRTVMPAVSTPALSQPPTPSTYTVKRSKTSALREIKRFTEPSSAVPPDNLFEEAQNMVSFGHIDQARDLLLRWLTDRPTHAPGCALLGKVFANLGNWPEAERWCNLAIAHDSLNLEAYYTLALVFFHQGRSQQAVEMMKKVIYIDRNDILGHFTMADLLHSLSQDTQATKYLENARRLLQSRPVDELVARSGDITVGRLAETVIELQQTWGKPTPG